MNECFCFNCETTVLVGVMQDMGPLCEATGSLIEIEYDPVYPEL
jgi:hypothetical protein